jgi:transcriptional regulator with XRE-family HTH domain
MVMILIGKRMQELRKAKKISLTELAEKSGVQIATLSRMENQKMTGTLESHMQIAKALEVDLTELYKDVAIQASENRIEVQKKDTQADVFNYSDKSSYEILTSKILTKKMMPVLLKIEPGGATNKEQNNAGSEKFIFVLDGQVEIDINAKSYHLDQGNTLYFDSSLPHIFKNNGKHIVKLICVTTPVAL